MKNEIKVFDEKKVRTLWDEDQEKWFFSVVDFIAVLTDSDRPRKYWNDLKIKLQKEGSQLSEKIGKLKMKAADGKNYNTDLIYKTQADKTAKEYKQFKGLRKENLRDNMTNKELVLSMLAELSTKEISEASNPETFSEHISVAKQGGTVAKNARMELEQKTGKKVVSPLKAKDILQINGKEDDGELV